MIDIHSHILPGVDDGAQTEEDSLAMAREAVRQGVHTIIATPHHRNGSFDNLGDTIIQHVDILNELFKNLPLTVLPGQEIRMNGDIIDELKQGDALTLANSKYVFVEFPSQHVPHYAGQMLFDLQVAGYTPIIVHPERNSELIEHPDRLFEFVHKGALTQITSGSVIGKFGKTIQKFTHQLIDANLAHFVASDAHNTTSRSFWMHEAYDVIQDKYGEHTKYVFMENSQLLIDDMHVHRDEPFRVKRKKILGLF
ncbi:tyrosine-protein phosphatase [Lentibacillus saliphilus]|uniref:tyrosine-protein phosphatase n=1 Tax=Lentibacillus saliphilus TaxID=2737028 RepID=UPI001C3090D1|nr:CpsB/CapC family capsule biosynthesis tyrosine phosphatase [Lentibacillus saliphilus]